MKTANITAAGVLLSAMTFAGAAVATPDVEFSQQEFRSALIAQDRIFKKTAGVQSSIAHPWAMKLSAHTPHKG